MSERRDRWNDILAELERKRAFARSMGGAERLEKRRVQGLLNARERAALLFDDGVFVEIGLLAGAASEGTAAPAPADALIAAHGTIDGRPAFALIEDFTVLGGSIGDAGAAKRRRVIALAKQERAALVFMLDGAGHRLTNAHATPAPNDLQALADVSGHVPIVCLVMGPAAGHSALAAPLSDFVVMTPAAALFVAGPPLVRDALGETVSKEALGGPGVHLVSGVAHNAAADDADAIRLARRYLSYLPRREDSPAGPEAAPRRLPAILDLIDPDPRVPFDMRDLLGLVVDEGSLLEIQPGYGAALVTALARLGGRSIAILANNPAALAGAIDRAAAEKGARFLAVAEALKAPAVFLADNPGVMPGTAAERAGTLRAAAGLFAAQRRFTAAKLHVTLRKAYGFGSSVMAMNPFDGQTLSLAFPAISLAAMPATSGAKAGNLSDAQRLEAARKETAAASTLADKMAFDDVIDPRDLRNALIDGLKIASAIRRGDPR